MRKKITQNAHFYSYVNHPAFIRFCHFNYLHVGGHIPYCSNWYWSLQTPCLNEIYTFRTLVPSVPWVLWQSEYLRWTDQASGQGYHTATMVYRWLYTYSPIFCIECVSKLSRQSISPSTDHKFASSLSVNCHDSQFHRLPTMKFASSLSVNCHDSQFHRLPTISWTDGR